MLTSFGRGMRLTERVADPAGDPDVVELDVTDLAQHDALAEDLRRRWGTVDGAHAVGFAPEACLGQDDGCSAPDGTTSPPRSTCRPTRSSRWPRPCCR